ncbi:hexose transporter [Xylariales sp. PMI_506]|nr:hexose transporter [Xylariales sp. PMI_506]
MSYERKLASKLIPINPTTLTVLLVAVALVNSATLGYDNSMMSGLNILPSYSDYFQLNTTTTGLNTAAMWIGQILGCFAVQPIPDRYGRKSVIWIASFVLFVGIILQASSQNIAMFVISRIIVGFGAGFADTAVPTLLVELLPTQQRGRVMGLFFSCYYVGSLLSSIINYGSQNISSTWSWRLPSLLQIIPSILAVCLLPFIPESPRWLINVGREEEAQEILKIVQGDESDDARANDTLQQIKAVIEAEAEIFPSHPYKELFMKKVNRKRLIIIVSFGIMLQTWGNFVISYYLGEILNAAGVTETLAQTQINVGINCWCFVLAIAGSFLLDVFGRRTQALVGGIAMTILLFIAGALTKVYGSSSDKSGIYGTIAVVFLFQGTYSLFVTPLTSLYTQEISSFKTRATAAAVCRLIADSCGLVFSFAMPYAMENLGWKFYMINGTWDAIYVVVIYLFFVETKGMALEEISVKFEGSAILQGVVKQRENNLSFNEKERDEKTTMNEDVTVNSQKH